MDFASANSLDGSSFGLSCSTDSTATVGHPSGSEAVGCRSPPPHKLMMSFVYDWLPPAAERKI